VFGPRVSGNGGSASIVSALRPLPQAQVLGGGLSNHLVGDGEVFVWENIAKHRCLCVRDATAL